MILVVKLRYAVEELGVGLCVITIVRCSLVVVDKFGGIHGLGNEVRGMHSSGHRLEQMRRRTRTTTNGALPL